MIKEFLNSKLSEYTTQKTKLGIGGFTAFVDTEESVELSADVTTNYVESGDYISDHVVLKPITISISGEVGNMMVTAPNTSSAYNKLAGLVGKITPYFPKRTSTQVSKIFGLINTASDTVSKIDGYIKDGVGLYNLISGNSPATKLSPQEEFFNYMMSIHKKKIIVDVDMFNKRATDMMLTQLTIRRNDTSYLSFSATFIKIRFAQTTSVNVKKGKGLKDGTTKGANKTQTSPKKSNGTVVPKRAESVLNKGVDEIKGLFK